MRFACIAAGLALMAAAAAGPSYAGVSGGSIWENDFTGDASIIPAGPADSTFTTSAINYDSRLTGYTIGQFLNDPTGADFSNPGIATDSLNNVHIQLVGSVGLLAGNNLFSIAHDDGLVLSIATFGAVVNTPGPTAPTVTNFNVFNPGPAGNFAFQLDYNECCGPPAVLTWSINDVVVGIPEPATWALLIFGFGGVGAVLRRRRQEPALV